MLKLLSIGGAVFFLAGLTLSVMLVVQGFKVSKKQGILSLLAPLLLAFGIGGMATFAVSVAKQEEQSKTTAKIGDQEFKDQVGDLDEMDAEDMDLGL